MTCEVGGGGGVEGGGGLRGTLISQSEGTLTFSI